MYTVGHSRVIGTGIYLPEQRVSSRELFQQFDSKGRFGVSYDWLERTTGIRERRVTSPGILPSDMAVSAAREAMERARLQPDQIDVIIYAGVSRDYLEPATAHLVQDKIGAKNSVVFDLTNACHGFMNAVHVIDALIATEQARYGLVVSGEQPSRSVRQAIKTLCNTHDRDVFKNLAGSFTLGDAGAAMVLGPKRFADSGFRGFMLRSQGKHANLCVCGIGDQMTPVQTDMPGIVKTHIEMHAVMYREFLQHIKWNPDQIDQFVHHQVGTKAFKMHAKYSHVPTAAMSNTVTMLGNVVTATIPLNLHFLADRRALREGAKVFISGSGSGLSVSQSGLVWENAG